MSKRRVPERMFCEWTQNSYGITGGAENHEQTDSSDE